MPTPGSIYPVRGLEVGYTAHELYMVHESVDCHARSICPTRMRTSTNALLSVFMREVVIGALVDLGGYGVAAVEVVVLSFMLLVAISIGTSASMLGCSVPVSVASVEQSDGPLVTSLLVLLPRIALLIQFVSSPAGKRNASPA